MNHVQDADTRRAGAQHDDLLLRQGTTGNFRGAVQRPDGDGGGALDVVVEGEQLVAVAAQDRQRVCGGEVLPLQQDLWQRLVHRADEAVDERVVLVVVDATVPPAEVTRILQELDVVGAHIEHDRQRTTRVDTADQRVERQLADRNAHPADALISQTENALPVGHHDHVDLTMRPVVQHLVETVTIGVGHEQTPWPPVDLAETLAGLAHGRGVHDRQGLGNVVPQHPVEQRLVAILQGAQVDVLVEIVAARGELVPAMCRLLVLRLDRRRQ